MANSRKIGLPRNETTSSSVITPSSPWKRVVEPPRRAVVERGERSVGGHLVQQQPERDAHQRHREDEQRGPQLVATERSEFDGDPSGNPWSMVGIVPHVELPQTKGLVRPVAARPARRCAAVLAIVAIPLAPWLYEEHVAGAGVPAPHQGGVPVRRVLRPRGERVAAGDRAGRAPAPARRRVDLLRPRSRLRRRALRRRAARPRRPPAAQGADRPDAGRCSRSAARASCSSDAWRRSPPR